MTNPIPDIEVKRETKKISTRNPNIRDVACLIGGFETDENYLTPVFYETLAAAEADLYDGSESTLPYANKALRKLFNNDTISGVLCVNVSVKSGTNPNITWARTVTKTKLENSLAAVRQMEFDNLYVAEELTDELITVIDDEAEDRFEDKKPFVWVGAASRANASAYTTTAGKLGDYCAAFLTQTLKIDGTTMSLVESGAWLCNYISRTPIANSLTAKILDEVEGVGTDYTFADSDLGTTLVGLGFFVVRLLNPQNNTYECVNSAGANGLDMYINRCTSYIMNDFALRQFLGEHNGEVTIDGIKMECNRLLTQYRGIGAVKNINYAVEKVDSKTAKVILNSIEYEDILTKLYVYVTIEVV